MKVIHYIGINSAIRSAGILSVLLFSVLSGLTFLPLSFHTDITEAASGTAAESTITLDVTNNTASVDLTVSSTNGTFATSASSDEASFSVTTNNFTGYTLSISASDNDGTLVNGSDTLASIPSSLSESQFDNATYNGKWGWKPSKLNSTVNTDFLQSPTTEAVTLDTTSTANSTANNYTIALGARADYTKPAGTYTKTFILTAVGNKINYSVTYNANAGTDTVTNMPYPSTGNTQSGDTNSTTITLSDLVPVRDGYNFKGWCSTTTSDDTCSGTIYNPDGAGTDLIYGIDQTTINVGTLYAMWKVAAIPMQNLDYSLCTTEGIQVRDTRDGEIYLAKRLDDGNCWMVENLNLAGDTALSATDTNVDSSYISSFTTSRNLTKTGDTIVLPTSSTSGFNTDNYSYVYNSGNKTDCGASGQNTPCYSYYSWDAATLGSGRSITANNTDAPYSICPKGWRLPNTRTGTDSTSDFRALMIAYGGSNTIETYNSSTNPTGATMYSKISPGTTPNFLLAGHYYNGLFRYGGSGGGYWSATSGNSTGASALSFNSGGVGSADSSSRRYGISVRCLLNIPYLQDQTTTTLAADLPNAGDAKTYRDKRDNELYLVGHLADGKYWLLDNLRLDLTDSTVLANTTADNTNASTTTLNYLMNGGGSTSDQYATAAVSNWTSDYSYSAPLVNMDSKDVVPTGAPTGGSGSNKVGGYYNFCAASAGSYCYGNGSSAGTSSGDATEDICPKGWRIPTGDSSGEYQALYRVYGNYATNFKKALSAPLSGFFYNGSASNQGSSGYFWSSTRSLNYGMYLLSVDSSSVRPSSNSNRYYCGSVRCLRGSNFLQDQTTDSLAADLPNVGDTKTYYDKRDGQGYQVAHLADGKYWMVENLNLAGGTALSATDTDVDSSYISNFTTSNNLTKNGDTIVLPASSTSGFDTDNYSYVYNSGNKTNCGASGQNTPCYSYYSWDATTLGSGRTISTNNTNAPYSICPKAWRLPTAYTTSAANWQTTSDFYVLAHQYGLDSTTSTEESDDGFYTQAGPGTVPNFLLAGRYYFGSFYVGGSAGIYWSATLSSNTSNARSLNFSSSSVNSANYFSRGSGFSVRCLLAE